MSPRRGRRLPAPAAACWLVACCAVSTVLPAQDASLIDAERARRSYQAFLELAPAGDPRRADALRRLADLELERAEELLMTEGPGAASDAAWDEAIRLYEALLDAYPERPNGDVVLYQLARACDQRGETDASVAALGRLVREYPQSALVDEAWFRRGEAFFLQRDFDLASEAYGAVVAHGEASSFFEQALYKRGWSLFRETRYGEGLESFWALLARMLAGDGDYAGRGEETLTRAERELLDDTLRAMSVSFSYQEGVASLDAFLRGREARYGFEHLLYAGLGDLYLSQERYNDAAAAYDAFHAAWPEHREAPLLQLKVIETYAGAGFAGEALAARETFAERYALTAPFWSLHAPEAMPEVVDALKMHLTDLTEYYHARAQAGAEAGGADRAADYATATHWYRRWLESFPDDPETPGRRFLLAELLFEQARFEEAALEYERTAYDYGLHAQAAEAGYAALLAIDEHAAAIEDAAAREAWRRGGVESALRFAETFPAHAQAPAVLTRASEDLFAFGEYAAASAAAERVTAWEPAVPLPLLRTAWTVIGHARFELEDYLYAERAYRQLLALPLEDAERDELTERLAASVYRQAEQHRDAGDMQRAVEDFMRVAEVAPGSPVAATADYDAAAALVQLEAWERAATALTRFRQRYPEHELADEVTRKLAAAYLATGDAPAAARELETVARTAEEPVPVRIDAAWNAAEQYEAAGDPDAAMRLYGYLVDDLPVALDERVDAQERIAALHARQRDTEAELAALGRLIEIDRQAGSRRSDRSRTAAAGAALRLAAVEREAFERIELRLPLDRSLAAKQQAMKQTLDAYDLAAQYGIAEVSTAAAYHVANLYLSLGRALMDSERPADLDALALEQYELLLEEQAFPFEEQGISLHVSNTARTVDGVWNEWVEASFQRLADLVPARYAKSEKGVNLVTYLE